MIIIEVIRGEMVGGGIIRGGIVLIKGVFIYFEILAGFSRVRVRSAEFCFDYIFTVNLIINRLINMYLIGI
jgi:hypothetical protein